MGETTTSGDLLLKRFFPEVSKVERDNKVVRILTCFKLNPYERLNLPFDSSIEDAKKQYRKISLLVQPHKCKHPKAQEAFEEFCKQAEAGMWGGIFVDRSRSSTTFSSKKKFKDKMAEFQTLRENIHHEYQEVVDVRIRTR